MSFGGFAEDIESVMSYPLLILQKHVMRAIELNPKEPLLYYLLGRWCFAVSMRLSA